MRGVPDPALRDTGARPRQLQRCHRERALPDGDRNGFAGVPFLPEITQLPLRRGHHALRFVRQVDAGLVAQPELIHIPGYVVDARAVADVVEIDVARLSNSLVKRHTSMPSLKVALEVSAVKRCTASTTHGELIVD